MNSLYVALNMLKRTLGHKKGLFIFMVIPALVISLIIGLIGQASTKVVTIAYLNQDQGSLGKHIIQELTNRKDFILKEIAEPEALKEKIIKKQADAAFMIPADFSQSLYNGSGDQVEMYQLRLNEATFTLKIELDSLVGQIKQTISSFPPGSLSAAELKANVEKSLTQIEKHQVRATVTDYNLYLNPANSTIIGFMLMFMMGLISSTVSIIVEDRRQKTMARMFTAPIRSVEIALGNFLGSFIVGTLQVLFILLFTRYVLQHDYHLPFLSHLIILEFFVLASMGIASAIAGLMKNVANIGTLSSLVISPTCMLGGCFWPISIMPVWMQKLSNFVPQKWAIDAIERMSTGQGLTDIGMNIGVLALFAVILLGIGSVILQPQEAEVG
jgi:ABC-2 type transport system permease protein